MYPAATTQNAGPIIRLPKRTASGAPTSSSAAAANKLANVCETCGALTADQSSTGMMETSMSQMAAVSVPSPSSEKVDERKSAGCRRQGRLTRGSFTMNCSPVKAKIAHKLDRRSYRAVTAPDSQAKVCPGARQSVPIAGKEAGTCEHSLRGYRYVIATATTMTSITHFHRSAMTIVMVCTACLAAGTLVGAAPKPVHTDVVTLSLMRFSKIGQLDAGPYVGVSPGRLVIHVGDAVVFSNVDTRHHTATGIPDETTFPSDTPRWTDQALKSSGKIGPGSWSTGDLAPGQHSAPMVATRSGTFLYGCFYDYSAGMRGEIVVEP
jgi:plastocyanin